MIKATAITRATLSSRGKEMAPQASTAPIGSGLLLRRGSPAGPLRGLALHPTTQQLPQLRSRQGMAAHPQQGFLLFLGSGLWPEMPAPWPSLRGRGGSYPSPGRQGLPSADSLATADSGAAILHEICRLSETLHPIGNIWYFIPRGAATLSRAASAETQLSEPPTSLPPPPLAAPSGMFALRVPERLTAS